MARSGQCTHLTMTRVYNPEFRCGLCLQRGSFGWLYRCTQDRELMTEDEFERGCPAIFDKIPMLFAPTGSARARSPAMRMSSELSFFDEINDNQLNTYSPEQIEIVLKQRAHVIETINNAQTWSNPPNGLQIFSTHPTNNLPYVSVPPSFDGASDTLRKKPWLPVSECQFKVCHRCRGNSADRAWLSLSGIANGDYPMTAVIGYGFHLQAKRPVAKIGNVINLGLRENPSKTQVSETIQKPASTPKRTPASVFEHPILEKAGPFDDQTNADTTFGQDANAYDSASMTKILNAEHDTVILDETGNPYAPLVQAAFHAAKKSIHDEIESPNDSKQAKQHEQGVKQISVLPIHSLTGQKPVDASQIFINGSSDVNNQNDNSPEIMKLTGTNSDVPSLSQGAAIYQQRQPADDFARCLQAEASPFPQKDTLHDFTIVDDLLKHLESASVSKSPGINENEPEGSVYGLALTEEAVEQHNPDITLVLDSGDDMSSGKA